MAFGATAIVLKHGLAGPPVAVMNINQLGDGAYATGGNTGLQAALRVALNSENIEIVACSGKAINGKSCHYDKATDKLVCFLANGTEESAAADLSSVSYQLTVHMK